MITLYRVDDGQNMHRFYHLRVEQTLFGGWALIREWGRIGSRKGQILEEWFEDIKPAEVALQRIKALKVKKGYSSAATSCGPKSEIIRSIDETNVEQPPSFPSY